MMMKLDAVTLMMMNLFNEAFRFNARCIFPAVVPVHFTILFMIQSKNYILSSDFVATNRKLDIRESISLWKLIHNPEMATVDDIFTLVFDKRSYGVKASTT